MLQISNKDLILKTMRIFSKKLLSLTNKTLIIAGILLISTGDQFIISQQEPNSASATASATIVTPIGITKSVDMNFGSIVASTSSGTLILEPTGNRLATGGITLVEEPGTVSGASFVVTGEGSYTYTITLPTSDFIITNNQGSETMLINNFTSSPSETGTLTSGTQTIFVGATLIIKSNQPIGEYKSVSSFDVTVNYN